MFFLVSIALLIAIVYFYMKLPKFGKQPSVDALLKIQEASNYLDNKFQNISHTPDLTEGVTYYKVLKEFIFNKEKHTRPPMKIPSLNHQIKDLNVDMNCLVWFGHSSYLMQIDGKIFLVDPIFSGSASPLKFTTKSFEGSNNYSVDDMPLIDYLIITHDHWDHLDYDTIKRINTKVSKVICSLGVAEHLVKWGYTRNKIIEKNWYETEQLEFGFEIITTPGRHFSGRSFRRQQTLWASYVLNTPSLKIFIGGDSGYDKHFKEIGKQHGPFDLAILECGQYNKNWKYIHMMPEETAKAAIDLNAKMLMPVHWAKFTLAQHAWDDSIKRVVIESEKLNLPLIHPMIGELVDLNNSQEFSKWWEMSTN